MINPHNYSQIGLAVACVVIVIPPAQAVVEQVVGGISTSMTISQIFSGLDDLINKARDAGDYLTMRAAMEAKGAIEAWKEANKDLLDVAFSKLEESQRNMFNNARQLTERANDDVANRLETTKQLVNQTNQIVESIPLSKNTYVTSFTPRVKPAQASSTITLHVNGVNLDKGDPVLSLGQSNADRMVIGPLEVQYTVPASVLKGEADKLSVVPLKLTYSTPNDGFWNRLFGSRESVERQLPVVTLPTNMGHFVFTIDTKDQQKESKLFTAQQQKFEGKNTNDKHIAKPPDGWRWDWSQGVGTFSQVGGGGEAGSCNGIMANESTQDGIVHSAHLDEIKQFNLLDIKYGPGWQNCAVIGPIYRMTSVTATLPAQSGVVTWTDDLQLAIPVNMNSTSLEVTTFDGRKRLFSDSGADKFFDVIKGGSAFIIRPRQPADL